MQAIVYRRRDEATTSSLEDRSLPVPGPGEVRVRVHVSGVNPIDAKSRGRSDPLDYVPNHDGAGVVDAVGPGVDERRAGQRVWLWAAGWQRAEGTAQEFLTLPTELAIPLPDKASFELGAAIGIPALTAHRCWPASSCNREFPSGWSTPRVSIQRIHARPSSGRDCWNCCTAPNWPSRSWLRVTASTASPISRRDGASARPG